MKTGRNIKHRITPIIITVAVILAVLIAVCVYNTRYSYKDMKKTIANVEHYSYYTIYSDNKPLFYFSSLSKDSLIENASIKESYTCKEKTVLSGVWINRLMMFPSCRGRIITVYKEPEHASYIENTKDLKYFITRQCDSLEKKYKGIKSEISELNYYLRVHGVQDEGFNVIAKHANDKRKHADSIKSLISVLHKISSSKTIEVKRNDEYYIVYKGKDLKNSYEKCRLISQGSNICLIQTENKKTPAGVKAVYFNSMSESFNDHDETVFVPSHSNIVPGTVKLNGEHDIPLMQAEDGSPVFNSQKRFIGIVCGKTVKEKNDVKKLFD